MCSSGIEIEHWSVWNVAVQIVNSDILSMRLDCQKLLLNSKVVQEWKGRNTNCLAILSKDHQNPSYGKTQYLEVYRTKQTLCEEWPSAASG